MRNDSLEIGVKNGEHGLVRVDSALTEMIFFDITIGHYRYARGIRNVGRADSNYNGLVEPRRTPNGIVTSTLCVRIDVEDDLGLLNSLYARRLGSRTSTRLLRI